MICFRCKAGDPGRTASDHRLFVNAALYVLKTGVPLDGLPDRFGEPNTVWKRSDRRSASGVWECVGRALGDADPLSQHDDIERIINSVVASGCRVPPRAASRRRGASWIRGKETLRTITCATATQSLSRP